nr:hypothetical protein [uncultured Desulfuromonas sp.]
MKIALIPLMALLLMLTGCGEEKTAQAPEQPAHETTATTAVQTVEETVEETVDAVKEKAAEVVDAGKEVAAQAVESVETAAKDVETEVADMAADAETKVSAATEEATAAGSALLSGLTEKAQSVTETKTTAETAAGDIVTQAEEKATAATSALTPPETVVIENNYGNVTLTHAFHGKTYGCPTCMATTPRVLLSWVRPRRMCCVRIAIKRTTVRRNVVVATKNSFFRVFPNTKAPLNRGAFFCVFSQDIPPMMYTFDL